MIFGVNNSPFAGREGKFVTSRSSRSASTKRSSATLRSELKTLIRRISSKFRDVANCSSRS